MGFFKAWSPRSPYKFRGNDGPIKAGFGVAERGFKGTAPGAPFSDMVSLAGSGGVLVKRDIHSTFGTYISGGNGSAQIAPLSGLTGGLYQVGALAQTALQQYVAQQAYNGTGVAPPPGSSFSGG